MLITRRPALLATCIIASVVGCVPNSGGVGPTLPWNRQVPGQLSGSTNPWAQSGNGLNPYSTGPSASSSPRWSFLADLQRQADRQQVLAQQQRRRLDQVRILQQEQDQKDRLYAQEFRTKERSALAKQYAEQEQKMLGRVDQLQGRATDLDVNNRDLHAQVVRSKQRNNVLQGQIDLLKRRLADTSNQLAQSQQTSQETDRRLQAMQASTRRRASASITANSSLNRGITAVLVPGMDIRQDGDRIRISIPSDKLFMTGTATLHQGSQPYIDQVARVILEHYPRQIVGIEAHTDQGPSLANTQWRNQHQLTSAQGMAAFEQLTARSISPLQLFVLGHGGNHPLVSDGTPQGQSLNRRIEVVIYPEMFAQR